MLKTLRDLLPGRAPPPDPSPAAGEGGLCAALAEIEAADFLDLGADHGADRFALIALSLDGAVRRDLEGLAMIEAIEATPRAHGRSHGLEWPYEQLFLDAVRLRQAAEIFRRLAPHEKAVRALLDLGEARS